MPRTKLLAATVTLALALTACSDRGDAESSADGAEISDFDAGDATASELVALIQQILEQGDATSIEFSAGEWHWHDLTRIDLAEKPHYASLLVRPSEDDIASTVRRWIDKHGVRGVLIRIDGRLPALRLIELEKVLTQEGVVYALIMADPDEPETVRLDETGGRLEVKSMPRNE